MGMMEGQRVLLTGAAGGIGQLLAKELANEGARLALLDKDGEALKQLTAEIGSQAIAIPADISSADRCRIAVSAVWNGMESVDCLINLADVSTFSLFHDEETATIETMMRVNLLAPMMLTHALLPEMIKRRRGRIVNIGSFFGCVGFAGYTAYSASQSGLRGFSQSLRRELSDTGVMVLYIAPRMVRSSACPDEVVAMSEAASLAMDEPDDVVDTILTAIEKNRKETCIGFSESLWMRLNGAFPGVVDKMLAEQNATMKNFAQRAD